MGSRSAGTGSVGTSHIGHWLLIIFHLFSLCFPIRFGASPLNRSDAGRARGSAARNQGDLPSLGTCMGFSFSLFLPAMNPKIRRSSLFRFPSPEDVSGSPWPPCSEQGSVGSVPLTKTSSY